MDLTEILNIVNISDKGRRRPYNEDSSACDARIGLLIVADGMGGYKAGEVASSIAVTSILNRVRNGLGRIRLGYKNKTNGYTNGSLLMREALMEANTIIFQTAQAEAECQ